ncbi:hypothetical protein LCGC14_1566400 [marine sediment metagenome]|uniref:YgjP-like metallopeptidase domain-containing protein n=1 Tax=marine sediment metagenome TaxID=412755 RepID=A0A0F9IKX8_9ZZZZ
MTIMISFETEILTGIYNTWELNNTPINIYNNFSLNDIDLERLKHDIINEYDLIIPNRSEIPISDYNFHLNNKDDILGVLKESKIRFNGFLIFSERGGIELGRYDRYFNRIFLGRIIKLFPYPIIKYVLFHELMHILIFDHKQAFCSIINRFPRKLEIEKYLIDFWKCLRKFYLVKQNQQIYFSIKKGAGKELATNNDTVNIDRQYQSLFFHEV